MFIQRLPEPRGIPLCADGEGKRGCREDRGRSGGGSAATGADVKRNAQVPVRRLLNRRRRFHSNIFGIQKTGPAACGSHLIRFRIRRISVRSFAWRDFLEFAGLYSPKIAARFRQCNGLRCVCRWGGTCSVRSHRKSGTGDGKSAAESDLGSWNLRTSGLNDPLCAARS